MAKKNEFELLEKKLNIASSLIEELNIEEGEVILPEIVTSEVPAINCATNEVFSIDTLKSDFILIRQHVMKLITEGQRVSSSVALIDIADMKPQMIMAISTLHQTLGNNIELLGRIYKQISDIEKTRDRNQPKQTEGATVTNQGTIVNNNIVYTGSTEDLLSIIKQNQIT